MVLNTEEHAVEISAADIGTGESLGDAEAYILTSYPGVLTSRDAFLNGKCSSSLCVFFRSLTRGSVGTGKVLKLADPVKGVLPDMPPAKIPSGEQNADFLTKPLEEDGHSSNMHRTGVKPLPVELVKQKEEEAKAKK